MTKSRETILEILVLYKNTEFCGLANHGENEKPVNDIKGDGDLSGSEESDCSLTDIPDKVSRIVIIITIIILLCSQYCNHNNPCY